MEKIYSGRAKHFSVGISDEEEEINGIQVICRYLFHVFNSNIAIIQDLSTFFINTPLNLVYCCTQQVLRVITNLLHTGIVASLVTMLYCRDEVAATLFETPMLARLKDWSNQYAFFSIQLAPRLPTIQREVKKNKCCLFIKILLLQIRK